MVVKVHNCRRALIFVWIFALILTAPVVVTRESVTYVYFNNVTSVAVHCEFLSIKKKKKKKRDD